MVATNFNTDIELESVTNSKDIDDFLIKQEKFLILVSVGGSQMFDAAAKSSYRHTAVGRAYFRLLPDGLKRHIAPGLTDQVSFLDLQERVHYALTIRDVWEPRPSSVLFVRKAVEFSTDAATEDKEERENRSTGHDSSRERANSSTGRDSARERSGRNDRYRSSSRGRGESRGRESSRGRDVRDRSSSRKHSSYSSSRGRDESRGRDGSRIRDRSRGRAASGGRYGDDERYRSTLKYRDERSSSRGDARYGSGSNFGARDQNRSRDRGDREKSERPERGSTPGPHRYANGDQVQNSWAQDQRPMGQRSGSRYHEYEDRRCYKCGQQGHLRWDCPRMQKREEWRTPDDQA